MCNMRNIEDDLLHTKKTKAKKLQSKRRNIRKKGKNEVNPPTKSRLLVASQPLDIHSNSQRQHAHMFKMDKL